MGESHQEGWISVLLVAFGSRYEEKYLQVDS